MALINNFKYNIEKLTNQSKKVEKIIYFTRNKMKSITLN